MPFRGYRVEAAVGTAILDYVLDALNDGRVGVYYGKLLICSGKGKLYIRLFLQQIPPPKSLLHSGSQLHTKTIYRSPPTNFNNTPPIYST